MPGRYVFKLTVTDDQGLTGTDTVSIIVHPDPMLLNMVAITLSVGVSVLTQSELESLEQKLLLLLGDNTNLQVRDLMTEHKTGEAVLVFYVEKTVSFEKSYLCTIKYRARQGSWLNLFLICQDFLRNRPEY